MQPIRSSYLLDLYSLVVLEAGGCGAEKLKERMVLMLGDEGKEVDQLTIDAALKDWRKRVYEKWKKCD